MSTAQKKLAPYIIFVKENRATVVAENPAAAPPVVMKLLGAKWKALPEDEKKVYAQKAAEHNASLPPVEAGESGELLPADVPSPPLPSADLSSALLPSTVLPIARVKRIVKLDEGIRSIGAEAAFAVAVATECFIESLCTEVISSLVKPQKRAPGSVILTKKTITAADIIKTMHSNAALAFLKHDFPLSLVEQAEKRKAALAALAKASTTEANGVDDPDADADAAREEVIPPAKERNAALAMFAQAAAAGTLRPPKPKEVSISHADSPAEEVVSLTATSTTSKAAKQMKLTGKAAKMAGRGKNGPGILSNFVRKINEEEARAEAEARLQTVQVAKRGTLSGQKRSKSAAGAGDVPDDGHASDGSDDGNLALIRARASGKHIPGKGKNKKKSAAEWHTDGVDDEARNHVAADDDAGVEPDKIIDESDEAELDDL